MRTILPKTWRHCTSFQSNTPCPGPADSDHAVQDQIMLINHHNNLATTVIMIISKHDDIDDESVHDILARGETARSADISFNFDCNFWKFETFQGHVIAVFKLQVVLLMYIKISKAIFMDWNPENQGSSAKLKNLSSLTYGYPLYWHHFLFIIFDLYIRIFYQYLPKYVR